MISLDIKRLRRVLETQNEEELSRWIEFLGEVIEEGNVLEIVQGYTDGQASETIITLRSSHELWKWAKERFPGLSDR